MRQYRIAQLIPRMEEIANRTVESMEDAHRELIKATVQDHAQLTSGRVSEAELVAMGHPFGRVTSADLTTGVRGVQNGKTTKDLSAYARRKGNLIRKGVLAPLPINKQSGKLRESLKVTDPDGPNMRVDVYFDNEIAPYAGYVLKPGGTPLMTARGFYSEGAGQSGELTMRYKARAQGIVLSARKRGQKL